MQSFSLADINYLIFVIPGFMLVWTFRFFTRSEKKGEFELAGLSFFWGLIISLFISFISHFSPTPFPVINKIEGLYAASAVFSLFAVVGGFIGAWISSKSFFKRIMQYLLLLINKK